MSILKTIFATAILAAIALPAQAFSIKNLGEQPYTLTIEQLGRTEEVVIQPSQHYIRRGVGIILHRPGGKSPINAHPWGIYSIWPNGDIHIQRYEKVQVSGN